MKLRRSENLLKSDIVWRVDPMILAQMISKGTVHYDWQKVIFKEVARPKSRVAVSAPNESGKTSEVLPVTGLGCMIAFPGCQVISTAGSELQIREQLFPALRARTEGWEGWSVSQDALTVTAPSMDGLRPSKWIGYCPKDALTAEGFHDRWQPDDKGVQRFQPVLYIIDEAKSIKKGILEAMMRIDPFFALMISTPGADEGSFYEALDPDSIDVKSVDDYWTMRMMVDWNDCPHLKRPEKRIVREQLIRKFGENSAFIQSFVYGRFYRKGQLFVFDDNEAVRCCMAGSVRGLDGQRAAGLDLSAGGDEQVLYIRQGTKIIHAEMHREHNTFKLARTLVESLRKYNVQPETVVADCGGVGTAILSDMENLGFAGIDRYVVNAEPMDKVQFFNRYAEDHFHLRELIAAMVVVMTDDDILLKQMRSRRYEITRETNKIKMESKNDIASSPDRLDALVMCFARCESVQALVRPSSQTRVFEEMRRQAEEQEASQGFGNLWCEQ